MKKIFETRTKTEKALSELPQDVQPFKDTDFAKNALSRRQSAERACSLRRKRRLCAALSLAVCLIVAAAAMVSVLLLKSLTVQLYVATEESSHSDALDALFPDGCLEETFDGVSVEYFGETALPLTAARFRINRDDVFLVVRQSDSLELLFNILKEII